MLEPVFTRFDWGSFVDEDGKCGEISQSEIRNQH